MSDEILITEEDFHFEAVVANHGPGARPTPPDELTRPESHPGDWELIDTIRTPTEKHIYFTFVWRRREGSSQ